MGRKRPSRQASTSHDGLGHATTSSTLRARLTARLGHPLELCITDNARTMLSVRYVGGVKKVRAHAMFIDAADDVIDAAARYLAHGDRAAGKVLEAYIRANAHRIRPRAPQAVGRAIGRVHDLEKILEELLCVHCPEVEPPTIRWGARRPSRRRGRVRTIRLGVYRYDEKAIEVHPCLDAPWVPRYFVAWVVFHELVHHVTAPTTVGGRQHHHHGAFRVLEARFPERERALAWERANLRRLFACRDGDGENASVPAQMGERQRALTAVSVVGLDAE